MPGVANKVTTSSQARVPEAANSTVTFNIPPSVAMSTVQRETVASVAGKLGYVNTVFTSSLSTV